MSAYTVLIAFELEHKLQSTRTHDRMAGSDSDDSGFGDELAMTSTQTARTGSAGAGAPDVAAVGGKKTKRTGANGMVQVRAARMLVVHTYDLSTDVG